MSLTLEQIHAAQNNDLAAIAAVLAEMDRHISRLAFQADCRLVDRTSYREDFAQDAREALFLALPRFTGSTVDAFRAFIWSSMNDALKDKVREERYKGVDKDAIKAVMSVMDEAGDNLHIAMQLAQQLPSKTKLRLSPARAFAALSAIRGTAYLESPQRYGDNAFGTLADMLPGKSDTLPDVQPKVGHGAALEALSVLNRYAGVHVSRMTPRSFAANLPTLVEHLEDTVRVPRDPQERRYVLDAMAILRSAVSTTSEGDLLEELRDVSDERHDERAAKIGMIRAALTIMGGKQAQVLAHSFGIGDVATYGWGEGCDVAGLAAEMGYNENTLKVSRAKARKSFAKAYISLAARTLEEATALTQAAAACTSNGGRK